MCAIGGGPCLEVVVAACKRFDDDKHNKGNGLCGGLIKGEGHLSFLSKSLDMKFGALKDSGNDDGNARMTYIVKQREYEVCLGARSSLLPK
uniref:Uncharacterized protein n=1 Tax=Oryza glumipatula TaxID=40148 RepID=A0A0E0AR65_9ORYZ